MSKNGKVITIRFRVKKPNAMQVALLVAIALLVASGVAKVAAHDYGTAICNLLWIGAAVLNLSLNKRNMVLTETVDLMSPIVDAVIKAIDEDRKIEEKHE